jgi:hypothetical protein
MKILFASAISGSWTYIPEMIENLGKRGAQVDLFEIDRMPSPLPWQIKVGFRIDRVCRKVGRVGEQFEARARLAVVKRRLATFGNSYDAINIHFAAPIFRSLLKPLRKKSRQLVTSIWGSDFLRASPADLEDLSHIITASQIVTSNNPEIGQRLLVRFPQIEGKLRIVRFGLKSLDVIRALQARETCEESRCRLRLPVDKTVIAIGYNGRREQRHSIIIKGLGGLPKRLKESILAIIPMTSGSSEPYERDIEEAVKTAGISYVILNKKMTLEDVCRVRIVSDFVVNMQTTDSFAASIQEHAMAGSTMIVGNWLPYGTLEKMGVPLFRVANEHDITRVLVEQGAGRKSRECPPFWKAIYDCSSWAATIDDWLGLY